MDVALIAALACPLSGAAYDIDAMRWDEDDLLEAFLVSQDERRVRALMAGVAVLPSDFQGFLRHQGAVIRRTPLQDPRLARFLHADAGDGYQGVDFGEIIAHYRDLVSEPPAGYDTSPHTDDRDLADLLARVLPAGARARLGLLLGSGVGRAAFTLRAHCERALGIDSSLAVVRRARNIAVTQEPFFLPGPRELGVGDLPLNLDALARQGVGFAVGEAEQLPVQRAVADLVVVASGDARGPWAKPERVWEHARRVLSPAGTLICHRALGRTSPSTERQGVWQVQAGP